MVTPASYDTPQTPKYRSADDLVESSEELGYRTAGIYFLIDGSEIVYVGQSRTTILSRLAGHITDKKFDRVAVLQYPADYDLDEMEVEYIWRIQPKYNAMMPSNSYYMKKPRLKELLGVDGPTLNALIRETGSKSRLGGYYDIRPLQEL